MRNALIAFVLDVMVDKVEPLVPRVDGFLVLLCEVSFTGGRLWGAFS